MCEIGGCGGLTETNLWAGASGGCTPLHYDSTSNFLCQVTGRKRLLLISPGQTARLYPYPVEHPAYAFSMVDVEQPDLARFPSFRGVQGLEAVIGPGDCLWMPSHVWHYVKQFAGDETLSLNFWVGGRNDVRADRMLAAERDGIVPSVAEVERAAKEQNETFEAAATAGDGALQALAREDDALMDATSDGGLVCMLLGRHVEKEMAHTCGGAAPAAKLMGALAVGADARWPANSPGRGLASQVRQHLMTVTGKQRAAAVLRGLVRDGRFGLVPKLGDDVVGTDEKGFSSREDLRNWVRKDGGPANKELIAALM